MSIKKLYLPGDEWLYFRIYCGHNIGNKLLNENIFPLLLKLEENKHITSWFFIRYSDPDHHLRLRLKLVHNEYTADIIESINKSVISYVDDDLIWKMELGTYQPEYERYGKISMSFIEQLFYHDSLSYCTMLKGTPVGNDDALWLYAMLSADKLLDDFAFSLEEKKDILLHLSRSFGKEFGKDKTIARQLSEKYRRYRQRIESILSRNPILPFDDHLLGVLKQRSLNNQEDIHKIRDLYKSGRMEVKQDDLLSSLIHMSLNRIFLNNNRMHEMVIYDFLHRYYRSLIAQARKPAI